MTYGFFVGKGYSLELPGIWAILKNTNKNMGGMRNAHYAALWQSNPKSNRK